METSNKISYSTLILSFKVKKLKKRGFVPWLTVLFKMVSLGDIKQETVFKIRL